MKRFRTLFLIFLCCLQGVSGAEISAQQLRALLAKPGPHPVLIDIRPTASFQKGSLPGAINIPGQVLLEKKMSFSRGCILISDGIADKVNPVQLAEQLRAKGVSSVDYLKGGVAAWSELKGALTTTGKGSSIGRTTRTVTYQDLVRKTGDVCVIDLRSAAEREIPDGHQCPVAGFCGLRQFAYCANLKEFHRRNSRISREDRAGEMPLTVLVPSATNDAEAVLNSLLLEGYRRSAILIGGAEVIETEGRRGLKRSGASTVRYRQKPGDESGAESGRSTQKAQPTPNR
jgi:rhodanese-related sulfurtransferase